MKGKPQVGAREIGDDQVIMAEEIQAQVITSNREDLGLAHVSS
jgi:hypothetical protein